MALVYNNTLVNFTNRLDLPTSTINTKPNTNSFLQTNLITIMPKQQVEPHGNWNQVNSFKYLPCILVEE